MTLRHLRIFTAVCDTGSATAAGELLYIAQPSVSLAVAELEEYYGIKLFDRIGKRLHITEAGKHFYQYAAHIVGLFDDMEKEVRNFDNIGIIRLGTSVTIGNYLMPGYVSEFKEMHPELEVKVTIDNSDTIEQHVLSNRIDLGLIEGIVHSPYIAGHCFRKDELVLICANAHSFSGRTDLDLAEVLKEDLLLREPGSAGREIFDSAATALGFEVKPAWESASTQAIVRAVKANLGVSVLPYLLVKDSLDRQEISRFRLKDLHFDRKFRVIYHKNKFLTGSARDFISLCV